MKKITLYFLLIFVFSNTFAQQSIDTLAVNYAQSIDSSDLSKHLHILASDAYEGRATGENGQKMAAAYIAEEFETYGLVPIDADQNYLQEFKLIEKKIESVSVNNANIKGEYLSDFYVMNINEDIKETSSELVFAGFGIDSRSYSDYKDIDIKGKAVMILPGEPLDKNGMCLVSESKKYSEWSYGWEQKIQVAKDKGAAAVFILNTLDQGTYNAQMIRLKHWLKKSKMYQENDSSLIVSTPQVFFISPEFGTQLLGTSKKYFEKQQKFLAKHVGPVVDKIKTTQVNYSAKVDVKIVETENVLGMVEGSSLKDEAIIITAHYDHIGIKGGEVYNGADDDGSGTVTVIELAQAFSEAKANGHMPKRSIIFMGMTGEEKGLLGSEYYSNNPIIPLSKTVANLNIDMIGRLDEHHLDNPNYVYLIGSDMLSTELHDISEEANSTYKNIELDYRYNKLDDPNRYYYRSDHYNFAKHDIPVIFYFNGVHDDYHQSTDTVDKILFDKIENIAQLVFYTAWELSNREARIKVDKSDVSQ